MQAIDDEIDDAIDADSDLGIDDEALMLERQSMAAELGHNPSTWAINNGDEDDENDDEELSEKHVMLALLQQSIATLEARDGEDSGSDEDDGSEGEELSTIPPELMRAFRRASLNSGTKPHKIPSNKSPHGEAQTQAKGDGASKVTDFEL